MKRTILITVIFLTLFACNNKQTKNTASLSSKPDTVQTVLNVVGMSCEHCENTIQTSVAELKGILEVTANHEDSTTIVKYDASQLSIADISSTIEKKGYKVLGEK